jgi:predicted metal-dependent hydrolase
MMTESRVSTLFEDSRYIDAVQLFNTYQWYAAHDAFEELWHESQGRLRSFLQGIIQISVAEYHLENGNSRGSTLLMAEGLNHLKSSSFSDPGLDLDRLIELVAQRLSALQTGTDLVNLPLPSLQLTQLPCV